MRVLLYVETLTIGGLPNYVLDLARALGESGDEVILAHAGRDVPGHLDLREVEALHVDEPDARRAVDSLRAWSPDVVHLHLCSQLDRLEALQKAGLVLVRSFHDYTSICLRRGRRRFPGDRCPRALGWSCVAFGCLLGPPRPGGRLPRLQNLPAKLAERDIYRGFDALVVGSTHMGRVLAKNGFPTERTHIVPYFSRFDHDAHAGIEREPGDFGSSDADSPLRLLFAGQAVAGKGLAELVGALSGLEGNWQLTAVSSGPDLPRIRLDARRQGLDGRIRFIEWVPQEEMADHYRSADLFVLPSVWDDPGPLVGIEAFSFGTPVLAFPVGGIPDYVRDGETGYLTSAVSVPALTVGLRRAMSEASRLPALGRAARELVKRRHARQEHVDRLRAVYARAVSERSSCPERGSDR